MHLKSKRKPKICCHFFAIKSTKPLSLSRLKSFPPFYLVQMLHLLHRWLVFQLSDGGRSRSCKSQHKTFPTCACMLLPLFVWNSSDKCGKTQPKQIPVSSLILVKSKGNFCRTSLVFGIKISGKSRRIF